MKRGISPLIAWVLLISFAIAMALLVTKWVVDNVENVGFDTEKELYCEDVSLFIDNIAKGASGEIIFDIANQGNFKITRLSIGRETTHRPEEWCLQLNLGINLNPSETISPYRLLIGDMQGNLIGNETTIYQNCEDPFGRTSDIGTESNPESLTSLSIVPWITIDDKTIACTNQKIKIDNLNEPIW